MTSIINAALALASRPKSQVVKNTMEMYKRTWEHYIHVLTEAVDDITSIDDFLAVSVDGHFHVLATTNNATMNIVEQMSLLYECSSFEYMPKSGIAGPGGRLIPILLRSLYTDF
ncbi:catenin alpha-3 [Cricetulus griseus]|nr:catenin alpha-3 [Cricetulus griseus]